MIDAARVGGSYPSYRHSLFMLGQYLNQQQARNVTIAEVSTGFMVLFYPEGRLQKVRTLMVEHADLMEFGGAFAHASRGRKGGLLSGGDRRDRKHPLLPQGYGAFLSAIGHKLDARRAVCVTICEAQGLLYVDYWVDKATFVIRDQRRQAISSHQSERYDAVEAGKLIDLVRNGTLQESSRHLGALRINPHDHISALAAAFLFEDEGKYRDAEEVFKRIIAAVPEHPEAHYHIARHAHLRGDRSSAAQSIRRALQARDDVAAIHDLHGRILASQRKLKEAADALMRAIAIDPDHLSYHANLAKVYEGLGRKDDAAAEMAVVSPYQPAPVWEMRDDDPGVESVPVAAVPARVNDSPASAAMLPQLAPADQSPASAALLPPLPPESHDEEPATAPPTQFEPAAAWMPPAAAGAAAQLTPFPAEPASGNWFAQPVSAASSSMTLEQRLRGGGQGFGAGPSEQVVVLPPGPPDLLPPNPPGPFQRAASIAPPVSMPAPPFSEAAIDQPLTDGSPGQSAPMPTLTEMPLQAPPPAAPLSVAPLSADDPAPTVAGGPASAENAAPAAHSIELAAEIMMIQRALESEPNRADLHRKLGFLLARQGHTAEAASEFRKALECSRANL